MVEYLKKLRNDDVIEAVMLFGSAARDELKVSSDIDAIIIVDDEILGKGHTLHPVISDVKLDLGVYTFESFEKETKKQAEKIDRIPMVGDSKVLFDKTGNLTKLRESYIESKPILTDDYRQFCKFMITHNNEKVLNNKNDLLNLVFLIGTNLEDSLKRHYQLQGRWRIADKRIIKDLEKWDLKLHGLVISLIEEVNPKKKLEKWTAMNKYLYEVNQIKSVVDTSCDCDSCKEMMNRIMKN